MPGKEVSYSAQWDGLFGDAPLKAPLPHLDTKRCLPAPSMELQAREPGARLVPFTKGIWVLPKLRNWLFREPWSFYDVVVRCGSVQRRRRLGCSARRRRRRRRRRRSILASPSPVSAFPSTLQPAPLFLLPLPCPSTTTDHWLHPGPAPGVPGGALDLHLARPVVGRRTLLRLRRPGHRRLLPQARGFSRFTSLHIGMPGIGETSGALQQKPRCSEF